MKVDQGLFTEDSITIREMDIFLTLHNGKTIHMIGDPFHTLPTRPEENEAWLAMIWITEWMISNARDEISLIAIPSHNIAYTRSDDGWASFAGEGNVDYWKERSVATGHGLVATWKLVLEHCDE